MHKVNLRLKMNIIGTWWTQHGDHPLVTRIPADMQLPNFVDRNTWGVIGANVISPGTWLIETGGNIFPVDNDYFHEFYEIIEENGNNNENIGENTGSETRMEE